MANNPLVDAEDFEAEDPATCPEYARLLARYDMPLTDAAVLGRGSMSVVRRAVRREDQLPVAVKQLPKQLANEALREVASMAELDSPDILRLFDLFVCAKNVFIVTELAQGGDLLSFIRERERLSEQDTREIARRLLRGVQYLHAHGIAHRDLKPENILCATKSPTDVRIADFSVSKIVSNGSFLRTMCGSPHYLAPEVLLCSNYSPKVDMWSLGVILYVCLTGFLPFYHDDIRKLVTKIVLAQYSWPPEVRVSPLAQDFISHLLDKEPDTRFDATTALRHPWLSRGKGIVLSGAK